MAQLEAAKKLQMTKRLLIKTNNNMCQLHKLYIQNDYGNLCKLSVNSTTSINKIKRLIEQNTAVPALLQQLMIDDSSNKIVLQNGSQISDYPVQQKQKINLYCLLPSIMHK